MIFQFLNIFLGMVSVGYLYSIPITEVNFEYHSRAVRAIIDIYLVRL